MSGCTIYAFIFLLYFSRYTTSLQTPGNTMKTLKCKYGAIKALLNVRLCVRLRRGDASLLPDPVCTFPELLPRCSGCPKHLWEPSSWEPELRQMLKVPIDFPGGGGSRSWLHSKGFPGGLSPWLRGAGGHRDPLGGTAPQCCSSGAALPCG